MITPRSSLATKVRYTIKVALGLSFLAAVAWFIYWLLGVEQIRNPFVLLLITLFLSIPLLLSIRKLPNELRALLTVWRSKDPQAVEDLLGDLREQDHL